jgi:hypothetical protein
MSKQTPPHWKVGKEEARDIKSRKLNGLPIVDAKHGLVLNIKKCDITGSKKADASSCAAARALKREVGSNARVYLTRTYIQTGKVWQRFITPQSISREIVAFDRGAAFEPGEYILKPPSKTQKLDHYRKSGAKTGTRKNKNGRKPRHVTGSVRQMR